MTFTHPLPTPQVPPTDHKLYFTKSYQGTNHDKMPGEWLRLINFLYDIFANKKEVNNLNIRTWKSYATSRLNGTRIQLIRAVIDFEWSTSNAELEMLLMSIVKYAFDLKIDVSF